VGVEPLPPNALTSGRRSNHPVLVAMSGRVASGKSTLARALSERLDAVRIVGDQVRDELLGDSRAAARGRHDRQCGCRRGADRGPLSSSRCD
jgi:adenylylsulfate kinase-like enzyme